MSVDKDSKQTAEEKLASEKTVVNTKFSKSIQEYGRDTRRNLDICQQPRSTLSFGKVLIHSKSLQISTKLSNLSPPSGFTPSLPSSVVYSSSTTTTQMIQFVTVLKKKKMYWTQSLPADSLFQTFVYLFKTSPESFGTICILRHQCHGRRLIQFWIICFWSSQS